MVSLVETSKDRHFSPLILLTISSGSTDSLSSFATGRSPAGGSLLLLSTYIGLERRAHTCRLGLWRGQAAKYKQEPKVCTKQQVGMQQVCRHNIQNNWTLREWSKTRELLGYILGSNMIMCKNYHMAVNMAADTTSSIKQLQ